MEVRPPRALAANRRLATRDRARLSRARAGAACGWARAAAPVPTPAAPPIRAAGAGGRPAAGASGG